MSQRPTTRNTLAVGAALTMAISAGGAGAVEVSQHDLIGSWAGKSEEHGVEIEFRVDAVGRDGTTTGARCIRWPAWMDTIITLKGMNAVARPTDDGRFAIDMALGAEHVQNGIVGDETTIRLKLVAPDRLDYTAVPNAAGRARGAHEGGATLSRTETVPCLDRWSAAPRGLVAPSTPEVPVVGVWTSGWSRGTGGAGKMLELAIESIDEPSGVTRGRYCVFLANTQDIKLVDLSAFEPLPAIYDANARTVTLPEPMRSATYAHVLIHLDGSAVRPWSLPGRLCTFGTGSAEPAADRVFVALEDTSEDPQPDTARALLRLMLASGTDD